MIKEIRKKPMSFEDLRNLCKKNDDFQKVFQDLELEYEIALGLVQVRVNAGLTQEEIATRMGTTSSVIARLESGRKLPTIKTLSQYAKAIGKHLYVSLE